jgi:tRNA A58 N-methylase Trm61
MKNNIKSLACCAAMIGTAFISTAADFTTGVTLAQNGTETTKKTEAPRRTPDVIYVPTPQEAVDQMLEMAEIKKGDVVYDLGCGDGRIVVTAAKKYGVKAVGFDIDPERIAESKENVRKNGVENLVTIEEKDIFTVDLSKADVVTLYLLPSLNVKLIPQLEKMKPGCRIVSHSFDMEGVKPDRVVRDGSTILYKWTTPLKKEKNGETANAH